MNKIQKNLDLYLIMYKLKKKYLYVKKYYVVNVSVWVDLQNQK